MALSIALSVRRLKHELRCFLTPEMITPAAAELGLTWKNTPLAVPNVVACFARQILGGNISMPELARLSGSRFTPEAYCLARSRLPVLVLRALLGKLITLCPQASAAAPAWKGHRLWHMDGSFFSMPDTPELQHHFGQPGQQRQGCGFPVTHLLCLFDAATGLIRDCVISPLRTHDLTQAGKVHGSLARGDIVIADRAFESYAHLALMQEKGVHVILPVHQRRKVDFVRRESRSGKNGRHLQRQRVRRQGTCDQVADWHKPESKPTWMSQEQFDRLSSTIRVREIKRTVRLASGRRQVIVLVTTLLDPDRYPAEELVGVLKDRWQVEVNLRHLKTTMKMDILRSQSVAGIEKELWMFLIVYNLVRLVMLEAAQAQAKPVQRISFADGLHWLRHGNLDDALPRLRLIPDRPGRLEPRVVKRRSTKYRLLTKPRSIMQKALRAA